jgi:mannosyltransferase
VRRWLGTAWCWPAVLVLGLGGWGLTRPGLWADELATWGVARLSWARLGRLAGELDGAITPYYAFMKIWTGVFGSSELALRLPSLLAMSLACALVGRLGVRLHSPRAGLLAGLLFAVVPATSRYAQEARVYAFLVLFVVLSTLLLYRAAGAAGRPAADGDGQPAGPPRLVGYAVAVALVGLAQFLGLLVLAAHAVLVLRARDRRLALRWAVAAGFGIVPALPLIGLALTQHARFGWIPAPTWSGLLTSVDDLFGAAAVAAFVVALALASRPGKRYGLPLAGWAVLPFAALLAVSLVKPVFWYRYLLFTVPAHLLLAGIALARLPVRRALVAVAVAGVLGSVAQVQVREPDGHGYGTRDAAAVIADQARPGDGIVYAVPDANVSWIGRDLVAYYVPGHRRPRDVFAVRPQRESGHLLASECVDLARCLGDPPRLWVVRYGTLADPLAGIGAEKERLLRGRYTMGGVHHTRNLTVGLLIRA